MSLQQIKTHQNDRYCWENEPVKQAMSLFEKEGFQSVQLAISHAFHSEIVASNEPLYRL